MKEDAFKIFMIESHREFVEMMVATSNILNVAQMNQGFHSIPKPYNDANGLCINMWYENGTIATPWFGGEYREEYYKDDKDYLMALELPEDIKVHVGSGSLIIDLEVDIREDVAGWVEEISIYTLYKVAHKLD